MNYKKVSKVCLSAEKHTCRSQPKPSALIPVNRQYLSWAYITALHSRPKNVKIPKQSCITCLGKVQFTLSPRMQVRNDRKSNEKKYSNFNGIVTVALNGWKEDSHKSHLYPQNQKCGGLIVGAISWKSAIHEKLRGIHFNTDPPAAFGFWSPLKWFTDKSIKAKTDYGSNVVPASNLSNKTAAPDLSNVNVLNAATLLCGFGSPYVMSRFATISALSLRYFAKKSR